MTDSDARVDAERPTAEGPPPRGDSRLLSPRATIIAATLVLVAFGVLVIWLLGRTAESDVRWNRSLYVYGSVEAIVFAAAGALFGTTVQRSQVARLEDEKARADQRADDASAAERLASQRATRGDALAASIRGMTRASGSAAPTGGGPALRGAGGGDAVLTQLSALVDELYGDR